MRNWVGVRSRVRVRFGVMVRDRVRLGVMVRDRVRHGMRARFKVKLRVRLVEPAIALLKGCLHMGFCAVRLTSWSICLTDETVEDKLQRIISGYIGA